MDELHSPRLLRVFIHTHTHTSLLSNS